MKKEEISTIFDEFLHTNVSQRPNSVVERETCEMQSPVSKRTGPRTGVQSKLSSTIVLVHVRSLY